MRIEHELSAAVREWLKGTKRSPYSAHRTVGEVMRRLPDAGRPRRRRWIVPWRRTQADPTRVGPHELGPAPFQATDGHSATVTGRTRSMFSPAKAITAGALAIAIGSVALIAQPFDRQAASVPGASVDDPDMAPSFFSGAVGDEFTENAAPVTVRRDDGVVDGTGESYTFSWDANDPRIAGTATVIMNETDYREGATTLAPTGDVGTLRSVLMRIVNDEGSWEGPLTTLHLEKDNVDYGSTSGLLTGSDAYEGLMAYVVWSFPGDFSFLGHITAEGPPPVPELPAE